MMGLTMGLTREANGGMPVRAIGYLCNDRTSSIIGPRISRKALQPPETQRARRKAGPSEGLGNRKCSGTPPRPTPLTP